MTSEPETNPRLSSDGQKKEDRRKFLRQASIGVAGLITGVEAATLLASKSKFKWDKETDVVIVGAGASGCSAALSASDNGAKVLMVEAAQVVGGAGSVCIGSITTPLSRLQKQAGIDDSVETYMEDILKLARGKASRMDKNLLRLLAENGGASIDWLLDHGVNIQGPFEYPGHRAKRLHMLVPKSAEWPKVIKPILEQRKIEILLGTKGVELCREADNHISGISAMDQNTGRTVTIKARRAVILTSGSLEGNPQLRSRATTPEIAAIPAAVQTNEGGGLVMAAAVGANMTMLEGFGEPFLRGMPPGPCSGIEKQAWMPYGIVDTGAILVNKAGKRFVNETANNIELCLTLSKQPFKACHLVFDQRIANIFNKWPMVISSIPGIAPVSKIGGFGLVDDFMAWNAIKRADTIEDLAIAVGVEPDGMKEEVDRWNFFCKQKSDPDFNRLSFGVETAGTAGAGITEPPYYCHSPLRALVVLADTSLAINTNFQVLDVFGRVIPRLYAAGNVGHGNLVLYGPGHGMHMAWAFTSGRLSGKIAAAERSLS